MSQDRKDTGNDYPTSYAKLACQANPGDNKEDFAESVGLYLTDKEDFEIDFPNRTNIIVKELERNGWSQKN